MREVAYRVDEIDGEPVSWREARDDPPSRGAARPVPVVYVHGVPNSSRMWLPFLERGGGLALDLPGFGGSIKAATFPFSIAGWAGFLERFLDWLGLDRVDLVMHDWGAAALELAARSPARIGRVVLIDALPLFDGFAWRRLARVWRTPVLGELAMGFLTPRLLRRVLRDANAAPLSESEIAALYAELDFGTQRAILRLHRSVRPGTLAAAGAGLGEIDVPALIVWGELDPFMPPAAAERYAAALGGPCETVLLADAGHWPWLDRADVVDLVVEFLTRS